LDLCEALANITAGRGVEIPDCSRDDLPDACVRLGYRVGVEVGVSDGVYHEKWCRAGLTMFGVDPWCASDDYRVSNERQDMHYNRSLTRLAPYIGKQTTLVRKFSADALADFAPGSLDFVYIDGLHNFKDVAHDIWEWSKKVRVGGLISGHDYAFSPKPNTDPNCLHVKFVVDAYTRALRIDPWFVLGRRETLPGEKRDKFRSWMWRKS
jgi:hypothetical protein